MIVGGMGSGETHGPSMVSQRLGIVSLIQTCKSKFIPPHIGLDLYLHSWFPGSPLPFILVNAHAYLSSVTYNQ